MESKKDKSRKKSFSNNKGDPAHELTKEDLEFKMLMEEGNVYKKVHGVTKQVR